MRRIALILVLSIAALATGEDAPSDHIRALCNTAKLLALDDLPTARGMLADPELVAAWRAAPEAYAPLVATVALMTGRTGGRRGQITPDGAREAHAFLQSVVAGGVDDGRVLAIASLMAAHAGDLDAAMALQLRLRRRDATEEERFATGTLLANNGFDAAAQPEWHAILEQEPHGSVYDMNAHTRIGTFAIAAGDYVTGLRHLDIVARATENDKSMAILNGHQFWQTIAWCRYEAGGRTTDGARQGLTGDDWQERFATATLLAMQGTVQDLPALRAALDDLDERVRAAAADAIGAIEARRDGRARRLTKPQPNVPDADLRRIAGRRGIAREVIADPYDKDLRWILLEPGFVLLDDRTRHDITTFDDYLQLCDCADAEATDLLPAPTFAWAATNRGVFGYDRPAGRWARFGPDAPVAAIAPGQDGPVATFADGARLTLPGEDAPVPRPLAPDRKIVIEAEQANLVEAPMEICDDPGASGGAALRLREGVGRGLPDAFCHGRALYHLALPRSGGYRVWVRGRFPDECSASFWVRADEGQPFCLQAPHAEGWQWARGPVLALRRGEHVIELGNREDGVTADQIALLSTRDRPESTTMAVTTLPGEGLSRRGCRPIEMALSCSGLRAPTPGPLDGSHHEGMLELPDLPGPSQRFLTLVPGRPTFLDVWARRNSGGPPEARFTFDAPAEITVEIPDGGLIAFDGKMPLARMRIDLAADAALRPGITRVVTRTSYAPGRVDHAELLFHRPLDWQVIGPFPWPRRRPLSSPLPPERDGFDADAAYAVGETTLRWRAADLGRSVSDVGMLDLAHHFGGRQQHVAACAAATVTSETARDVTLLLMHDDAAALYLNGERLFDSPISGPASTRLYHIPARFEAGENQILVKVTQKKGHWLLFLSIDWRDHAR